MTKEDIKIALPKISGKYTFNEDLSKHTWLGVGGKADVIFFPQDLDDLCHFLKHYPKNFPLFVLGGGSNLLIRDGGIEGVVIKLSSPFFKTVQYQDDILTCKAGLNNTTLAKLLIQNQIGGLEFLCSIPGTIGGLVKTNAGCFGKSLSDVLIDALVINRQGDIIKVTNSDFQFSYRHAKLEKDWIIIALNLKTERKDSQEIEQIINEQKAYRIARQPYNERTAGSTFKNPEGLSAWALIKQAECNDLKIGGAKVSDKHCNFLINDGSATAEDIEKLGNTIVQKVKDKTGITLEWEIQKVGRRR